MSSRDRLSVEGLSLRPLPDDAFSIVNEVVIKAVGGIPLLKGDLRQLPIKVQRFVVEKALLMRPRGIYICDGSEKEADEITQKLIERGTLSVLTAYENNYVCRTDPQDVLESKAWVVTPGKYQAVCHTAEGVQPIIDNWMSPQQFSKELDNRFPGCMTGRTMYVIPFSLGPIGGPISKVGIELTDSNYTVLCMRILTRVSSRVFDALGDGDFVRCIHSVGLPRPTGHKVINNWPCNPGKAFVGHRPEQREVWSFGSGYGPNSLLGKKSFALRLASTMGRDEDWLAEHMLIMGITKPDGKEHFIAAAFPHACGKTTLAMMQPTLPGWKVRCIGDDIAWMRFGTDGRLYGINPESGLYGAVKSISKKSSPMLLATFKKNCIFTNVAETANGEFFWDGLEDDIKDKNTEITNWRGEKCRIGDAGEAAHISATYMAPAEQCPIIHPQWESPKGVPIEGIIFGGRRPEGVPLVLECFSWKHGIFTGACLNSEIMVNGKKVVDHDPMAMRNHLSYNLGEYLQHWCNLEKDNRKMPKIFHVNWFREGSDEKLLWPGFGENIRILDWIIRRIEGDQMIGRDTAIGVVPTDGSISLDGLENIKFDEIMSVPRDYWTETAKQIRNFFEKQVGSDLPKLICAEMDAQEKRIATIL